MAETLIATQAMQAPFADVAAGGIDFVFSAADNVNGNYFVCTGREILLMNNPSGGALTVTVTSADDAFNRSEDITDYSLAAGDFAYFTGGLTTQRGWMASGTRNIIVTASSADVDFAVLQLP